MAAGRRRRGVGRDSVDTMVLPSALGRSRRVVLGVALASACVGVPNKEASTSSATMGDGDGTGMGGADFDGLVIEGAWDGDQADGRPVGDLNGDALDDIVVETHEGPVYVVFGRASSDVVELAELTAAEGVVISAELSTYEDLNATPAGDINGDGFDDVLLISSGYGGPVHVVFGGPGIASVDLEDLAPTAGRRLYSFFDDASWIEALGDVNGDGFDDLAVVHGHCCALQIDVIYGGADPKEVTAADLAAEVGGFIIGSFYWTEVAAGDINGDGFADILVQDMAQYQYHDALVHVIFGGPDLHGLDFWQSAEFDGFTITREGTAWFSVASGRDVNGDGRDDIVLVSGYSNAAAVVFGKEDMEPVALPGGPLSEGGFTISLDPPTDDLVTADLAPDLNGDGLAEVVLVVDRSDVNNAPRPDDRVHVVYGKADNEPVIAGGGEWGFSLDATPGGGVPGKFGGWAQVNGEGALDRMISAHEGEFEDPEHARVYVYFKETPD